MSGETGDVHSGWSVDTLHEHLSQQLRDLRSMLDERYETQTKATDKAFEAQQLAMKTALTAAETAVQTAMQAESRAVTKAEVAADKRFELLNELRGDVATKSELEALEKLITALASRMDLGDGRSTGLNAGWVYLLAGVAAIGTIVSIYLAMQGG
jgi:hypothetical protein